MRIGWSLCLGALLGAALAPGAARAGDGAAKELAALQREVAESKAGYKETYVAWKPRFEEFAAKHPGTEEALTAKLWLLGNTWWHREEGTMEKRAAELADAILRDHPKSKQLAKIPDLHYDFAPADRERIFRRLLETSEHPEVRGAALLRLALGTPQPARKAMLEKLRDEYGGVPYRYTDFAEMARAHLEPHPPADLAVGKPAPEILGRDVDGKPMKLSDFRGKVVVLDFWGDW